MNSFGILSEFRINFHRQQNQSASYLRIFSKKTLRNTIKIFFKIHTSIPDIPCAATSGAIFNTLQNNFSNIQYKIYLKNNFQVGTRNIKLLLQIKNFWKKNTKINKNKWEIFLMIFYCNCTWYKYAKHIELLINWVVQPIWNQMECHRGELHIYYVKLIDLWKFLNHKSNKSKNISILFTNRKNTRAL